MKEYEWKPALPLSNDGLTPRQRHLARYAKKARTRKKWQNKAKKHGGIQRPLLSSGGLYALGISAGQAAASFQRFAEAAREFPGFRPCFTI